MYGKRSTTFRTNYPNNALFLQCLIHNINYNEQIYEKNLAFAQIF